MTEYVNVEKKWQAISIPIAAHLDPYRAFPVWDGTTDDYVPQVKSVQDASGRDLSYAATYMEPSADRATSYIQVTLLVPPKSDWRVNFE